MKAGNKTKTKKIGQVFTPQYIVEEILNYAGYTSTTIIDKHIIDNSCGDGAFLKVIVSRYCQESINSGTPINKIKKGLEKYIHGIDVDLRCNTLGVNTVSVHQVLAFCMSD